MTGEAEQVVMIEPELADNDEADQPAQEFWQLIEQRPPELTDVGMMIENRHLEIEHQQRHRDREDAVAEGLDAGKVQLTLAETLKKRMNSNRVGEPA